MYDGLAKWGDYDNDGRLDFIITGSNGNRQFRLYHQKTDGTFEDKTSLVPNASAIAVLQAANGAFSWGDYDNHGRLDFVISGNSSTSRSTRLFHQKADGSFEDMSSLSLPWDVRLMNMSRVDFADYNKDGRLDFILSGYDQTGTPQTVLYDNTGTPKTNTPPSAPTGLSYVVNANGTVTLRWAPSSDTQTPSGGLSYQVYFSTTPGQVNKLGPASDQATGFRRVVQQGLTQTNSYTISIAALDPAVTYYWSVQAVDGAYAGSPFAPEQNFKLDYPKFVKKTGTSFLSSNMAGATWGDYDNDGLLDVLIAGGNALKLYRQKSDGTFEDKTASINLPANASSYAGVVNSDAKWGDYDKRC